MLVDLLHWHDGQAGRSAGVSTLLPTKYSSFDPESPFVTSGLRLGSPAMTTRGMGWAEFREIANIIADRLLNRMMSQWQMIVGNE